MRYNPPMFMMVLLLLCGVVSPASDDPRIGAVLYVHANYGGAYSRIGFNGAVPARVPNFFVPLAFHYNQVGNDEVSSIKVAPGSYAILFEHVSFEGKAEIFTQSDPWLGDNWIGNDAASSAIVKSNCLPPHEGRGVILFEGVNYGGKSEYFIEDDPDLRRTWIGNDTAASIKVTKGCTATLYEHIGYQGVAVVLLSDLPDLADSLGNGVASSIKVRCKFE